MKRIILIFTISFLCFLSGYSANYITGGSGYIGGVTLFDEFSPLLGLNNPGLLPSYGEREIDFTRIFKGDITGYKPGYKFGRIFLPSVYVSGNVSENTIESLEYFYPLILSMQGGSLGVDQTQDLGFMSIDLVQIASIFTLGALDISPLFTTTTATNQVDVVSNAISAIMNGDKPGVYTFFNINALSFYRHNFGFSIYVHGDVLAGLNSESRNLLIVNDPTINLNLEAGLALSFGFGERNLPLLGKVDLGATLRLHSVVEASASSIDDAMLLITEQIPAYMNVINSAQSLQDYMDLSAFGDGSLLKAGIGGSIDLGIIKNSGNVTIGAKLSDVISPVYWLNSQSLGWRLPDLSMGVKYTLPISDKWWMLINEPSLYFQIDDMLYTYPVAFLSKLHLGFDTRLFFDFLQIGAGLNQGYVTAGFALHITPAILAKIPILKYAFYATAPVTFFHLKYYFNIFGKELGTYPGESGYEGYNTGVELYIGF